MKKQEKPKQQKHISKKKQPLTFDQRFKDKMNVVGKLGVLDLLGLHQPFNLDRALTPIQPEVVEEEKNPEHTEKGKRKMSYSQKSNKKITDPKQRANKTDIVKVPQKAVVEQTRKQMLPRISKSSANIQLDLFRNPKQAISTKQYWGQPRNKNSRSINGNKKRSSSQLSCINILKVDQEANAHFQNLLKFQKINQSNKKVLRIQRR